MTKRTRHRIEGAGARVDATVGSRTGRKKPPKAEVLTDTLNAIRKALEDFQKVSKQAFDNFERRLEKRPFEESEEGGKQTRYWDDRLGDLVLYKEGLAWFGEGEGCDEKPIGKPEDYIGVRDDYQKLKDFLANLLKRGRIYKGINGVGDTSGETNTADYVIWMYKYSQNEKFKRNVERAVVELLSKELAREFAPLDIETELRKLEADYQPPWFHPVGGLNDALSRVGLQYEVESEDDRKFKAYFIQEMEKTERPITKDEYIRGFGGAEEDKIRDYETGEPAKRYKVCHYEETSPEFKAALKEGYIRKQAKTAAVRKFTPQFNTLVGLLDVVINLGKQDNGFATIYEILEQKARQGYFKDAPDLIYNFSAVNIYNYVLFALTALQKGKELREFWLVNIRNDNNTKRLLASVNGLLTCYESKEERKNEIPAILKALQERGYDVDRTQQYSAIGFIFDENLADKILDHIGFMCFDRLRFERGAFYHLDKEKGTLDFLVDKTANNGLYQFRSLRYTVQGASELTATYDLSEDRLDGNVELESTVRTYFDQVGYEMTKDVFVTSLEGRKIEGETLVVQAGEASLEGKYEGIVGLNHTPFGFVYDQTTDTILLAEPFDSRTVIFGVGKGSVDRRMGVGKIKAKIDAAKFKTLADIGTRVNEIVAEKKKHGYMGDSLYALDGKLSDEIAVHLARVVSVILVKRGDGIWNKEVK